MKTITRHFVDITNPDGSSRRVHYRKAGSGPPLLMVHQSPRSSAEYTALMEDWSSHFMCISPDTPGFGQSDPLPGEPEIEDFADAIILLLDTLGIDRCPAYGFHSGGIILMTAMKRHSHRFTGMAIGGYAIWTPEEMALFSESYLPPFLPSKYGEHLTWLWNRMLEQSWFFPWFDTRPQARLPGAHADLPRVAAAILEMLDSGHAYRAGYGAVLRATRDIPDVDADVPPCLITAFDGDPLQIHIDRLGPMPKGWAARKVATAADHHANSLDFLCSLPAVEPLSPPECEYEGFLKIETGNFSGLIHWKHSGRPGPLRVHAPGREADLIDCDNGIAIDLPGHGLSDGWHDAAPSNRAAWQAVIDAAASHFGSAETWIEPAPQGDPDRLFPNLAPDRFGNYLTRAWSIVRAAHFFEPWYHADARHAIEFDKADIQPEQLAREHRALIRSSAAAAAYSQAFQSNTKTKTGGTD